MAPTASPVYQGGESVTGLPTSYTRPAHTLDIGSLFRPNPIAKALFNYAFNEALSDCPTEPEGSLKNRDEKWLKNNGVDPHELKDGIGDSKLDIYIDRGGNIWTLPKNGRGVPPEWQGHFVMV